MPELLPTAKRDAFLAELVDTEPAGNELLIKGWGKRTIGPRTMRRLLDTEAEVEQARFILRVMTAFAMFPNDNTDDLMWRVDEQYAPITFLVQCSDEFSWATADCEPLTPENIGAFEQCVEDVRTACAESGRSWPPIWYAGHLFAARMRGMRPQGAAYPKDEPRLWPLFDACGPTREVGFGNPHPAPSERKADAN